MAWTTPRTWASGESVTSTVMNTHVRDNLNAIVSPPYVFVRANSTSTTLATGGSWVALSFDTEVSDAFNMWVSSAAPNINIATAGLYLINAGFGVVFSGAQYARARIRVNGTDVPSAGMSVYGASTQTANLSLSLMYRLSAGDYVQLVGNASAALGTLTSSGDQAFMQLRWMGP